MNVQIPVIPSESPRLGDWPNEFGFSAVDILRILRRRAAFIIGIIVAVTGLGTLITLQLTPRYRAEAVLILDSRKQHIANIQDVVSGLPADDSALRSELDVLTSRPLAGKVIDKLNLMSNPEFNPALRSPPALLGPLFFWLNDDQQRAVDAWIRAVFRPSNPNAAKTPQEIERDTRIRVIDTYLKKLSVSTDGRSLTMRIAMESENPELAAKIVNTHGDLYLLDQLEARFEATKRANTWLTQRVAELKGEVSAAERAVEEYRQKFHIISSDRGTTVLSQQLAELNSQLVQAHADRDQAAARLKQVRTLLASRADVDSIPEVLASQTIQTLRAQESQLVQNEAQLAAKYRDTHPTLINARAQLRDVRAKIQIEINRIIVSLEQAVDTANNKERSLQAAVDKLTQQVANMNLTEVHLHELEREADASRTLFENFLSQFKQTSAGPSIEDSDARVVSPADTPLQPNFPKKVIFLSLSLVLGVVIALGLTALLEMMDNGFRNADDIERESGISGLGLLPNLPGRVLAALQSEPVGERPLSTLSNPVRAADAAQRESSARLLRGSFPADFVVRKPLSSFSEAVRSIRTSLFYSNVDTPPKVILITSSVPSEGKTVLSAALARSAAMSGHKVLLLDADFRRPAVAKALGAPQNDVSVADLIAGKEAFGRIIQHDEATGLDFIAAPSGVTNPVDLLSSQQFVKLLDAVRGAYEFVFVDSPPVLAVADSLILARLVDAVVFAVRWEKTPKQVVLGALKQLRGTGATIAGSVLSRVNVKRHMRYGYGDRGYYYGRYGTYYSK
jgi:exopolysaccharide transport family protein